MNGNITSAAESRRRVSAGDRLLAQRLGTILSNFANDPSHNGVLLEQDVAAHLLQRHVEYRRKPKLAIKQAVQAAIASSRENALNRSIYAAQPSKAKNSNPHLPDAGSGSGSGSGPNPGPKRTSSNSSKSPVKTSRSSGVGRKRKRRFKSMASDAPKVRYADLGGMETLLPTIREVCEYPLVHRSVYDHLGVVAPCGILLHGPPGCGKTMLAHAIAGELEVPFFRLSAPEIVSGMSGESEEKIRALFDEAKSCAPSIIFLDEVDAIMGKRENSSRGMERRIVAQLLTCMDGLSAVFENDQESGNDLRVKEKAKREEKEKAESERGGSDGEKTENGDTSETFRNAGVLVIGATNRPDSLDSALRRAGRFDREIALGIPDLASRKSILRALSRRMKLEGEFDFAEVARRTPGFVGADLSAVCKEAAVIAVNRILAQRDSAENGDVGRVELNEEELESVRIKCGDFLEAIKKVQPSSKREGFVTVPKVSWDDIGALDKVRQELRLSISEPIAHPEKFARMGLSVPAGVLLYGPPGCGKTLLAKAVANSSGANFISVKGPELLNKFVGESERAVRQVFSRARASSPCIVFFDELDSLCPKRAAGDGNGVTERVVNQLLTEMDGLEERKSVFVVAATNRPDIIDPAMLRPGRLSKLLYVALPTKKERKAILRTCARSTPVDTAVDLETIATSSDMDGFSGADIAAVVREAALLAITAGRETVGKEDFEEAMSRARPSVKNTFDYQQLNLERSVKG